MGLNWIQYEKGILFHNIEFAHNDLMQLGRFKDAEIQRKRVLQAATGEIGFVLICQSLDILYSRNV